MRAASTGLKPSAKCNLTVAIGVEVRIWVLSPTCSASATPWDAA